MMHNDRIRAALSEPSFLFGLLRDNGRAEAERLCRELARVTGFDFVQLDYEAPPTTTDLPIPTEQRWTGVFRAFFESLGLALIVEIDGRSEAFHEGNGHGIRTSFVVEPQLQPQPHQHWAVVGADAICGVVDGSIQTQAVRVKAEFRTGLDIWGK